MELIMKSNIGNLLKVIKKGHDYIEFNLNDGSSIKITPKHDPRIGSSFVKLFIECPKDIKIETRSLREKEIQK